MAHPERLLQSDSQGQRLGYKSTNGGLPPTPYLHFLDVFRGPEELIRSRQRPYVPLLTRREMVVDVACGRGEMLDLLSEAGVPAVGVDINPDMVAHCKAKGYIVEEANALCFLERQSPGSVPAIFSAQFIEHLTFDELKTFLKLCRDRLRPGGVFIAETVNPHALEAFKTFYTDLTHQRPIFPEVALTLCELAGFERAHVMFPLGSGDLETDRQSQGEYAVVATSMAPD
jgi:SAM-dependent methyltransferase